MSRVLIAYIASAITFVSLDAVWISSLEDVFYRPLLGEMIADEFRLAPGVFFYLIYLSGVVYFAVEPALRIKRITTAAANGAMLGLVAFSTYDLTNQAILRHWELTVTLADIAWGTSLTALAAVVGFLADDRLFGSRQVV
jgi:uncharacterized membrane protein